MKVLFDTNVLIDFLLDRAPFADAATDLLSPVDGVDQRGRQVGAAARSLLQQRDWLAAIQTLYSTNQNKDPQTRDEGSRNASSKHPHIQPTSSRHRSRSNSPGGVPHRVRAPLKRSCRNRCPVRAPRHSARRRRVGGLRRGSRCPSGASSRREGAIRAPAAVGPLTPPEPLAPHHNVSQFSSGIPTLDSWLRGKARLNKAKGGARTYVACDGTRVAGFYSLAASSVQRSRVSSRVGRGMPDPVPVILLGQLAVDERYQTHRLGSDLLVNATRRCLAAGGLVGARAIIVQAVNEPAAAFYAKFGFRPFSEREPLMLILRMSEIEGLLPA